MIFDATITDTQRAAFLVALNASDLNLTDWEKDFMSSFAHSSGDRWFTVGRRKSAEAMWHKYGPMIGSNYPGRAVASPVIAEADVDACEYFVKLDGVQQHCNAPAAFVSRNNFRYCEAHAEQVQKDLRRRGGAIVLQKFQP